MRTSGIARAGRVSRLREHNTCAIRWPATVCWNRKPVNAGRSIAIEGVRRRTLLRSSSALTSGLNIPSIVSNYIDSINRKGDILKICSGNFTVHISDTCAIPATMHRTVLPDNIEAMHQWKAPTQPPDAGVNPSSVKYSVFCISYVNQG